MADIDVYLEQIDFPGRLIQSFLYDLDSCDNGNPRELARVCENYFSQYDFSWPQGVEYLKNEGKRGTYKQLCSLFAGRYLRLERHQEQIEQVKNCVGTLPYVELSKGPTVHDCPIHSEFYDKIFHFNPSFFKRYPFHAELECNCSWRMVSNAEKSRLGFEIDENITSPWRPITGKDIEKTINTVGELTKAAGAIFFFGTLVWLCWIFVTS